MTGAPAAVQVHLLVDARALDRPLDYLVPAELQGVVGPGTLVACPLGPRRGVGVVVAAGPPTHTGRLVPLSGVVDAPPVPAELMELAAWIAAYDAAPMAACLRLVLPPGAEGALRRRPDGTWALATPPRGPRPRLVARAGPLASAATGRQAEVVAALAVSGAMPAADLVRAAGTTMPTLRRMAKAGRLVLREETPDAEDVHALTAAPPAPPPEPTAEQAAAVARIAGLARGGGGSLLLYGVTGSGKTEVYLRAIEEVRRAGRGAIVLVPEISLTPQVLARMRMRLGDGVEVWHSAMAPAERAAAYARLREGRSDVVVGARSAVFAPVDRPGLVIVDEEHDASYKQDAMPRYDARQVAFLRATRANGVVVYGSATPRPETWHALERVVLTTRADGSLPPRVRVVDMRTQGSGPVSAPLARALRDAADRGEKAVILLNRRGFALMALCRSCGWLAACPSCDTSMVHHLDPPRLACHHCGREAPVPTVCPQCGAAEVMRGGHGTQGLEQALRRVAPAMRLVRMDASSASGRGAVARLLEAFAAPGPAVLLGTQMVAKGHDLPDVTVAAVLDADAGLRHADFRAEERTFSLIVQAAGRAGRRGEPATVIVQAFEPQARAVRLGADLAVPAFLEGELERRARRGMPPFGHLVRIVMDGPTRDAVSRWAGRLLEEIGTADPELRVMGPVPLHRLRGRHRRALLVRAERSRAATRACVRALERVWPGMEPEGVRAAIDVDPQVT
ncbi:MAG: primosomal protein N' [Thermoleophilia bacterium]|nr:primosomal protein N' [Thermoleophilia bacterium]